MSTTKTNFPGMNSNAGMQGNNPQGPSQMTQFPGMGSNFNKEKRPILGFLYSVSRTPYGEYWPLFVGSNPVGRGSNNAICLKESSVSDNHATIVVRRMQNKGESEGIFVFVQDTGSMYGTMLNGVTLDFNPRECKNGDIITIGANYELYVILIDPNALGLATKEGFQSIEAEPAEGPGWAPNSPVGMNVGNGHKGTQPGSGSPFDGRKATIYMPKK